MTVDFFFETENNPGAVTLTLYAQQLSFYFRKSLNIKRLLVRKVLKIEIFFNYFPLIGVFCLDFFKRGIFALFWR